VRIYTSVSQPSITTGEDVAKHYVLMKTKPQWRAVFIGYDILRYRRGWPYRVGPKANRLHGDIFRFVAV